MASMGERVLDVAIQQLGKRYVMGGSGPNVFDCSGLIMYSYRIVTGMSIPHATTVQWPFWINHRDLALCYHWTQLAGPNTLNPGDLMFTEFEGRDGHEMIFVGRRGQKYANPNWDYTYLQAAGRTTGVILSHLVWGQHDTAQGGARGIRFGRIVKLKPMASSISPSGKTEEESDMYEAKPGSPAYVPAYCNASAGQKCFLDITGQSNEPYNVRCSVRCDDGPYVPQIKEQELTPEISWRFEVGQMWNIPNRLGVTVKVECLAGKRVIVTRKQT